MLKIILLSIVLIGVGVAGMAITILFKKDGKFPDGEISHNKELRRRGVICAKEEELKLWKKHKGSKPSQCPETGCDGCAYAGKED